MPIAIVCAGRLRESYWRDAAAEYQKRMTRYNRLEIIEVPDQPETEGAQAMKKEGAAMLAHIRPDDYVAALCIDGKYLDSPGLADFFRQRGWCLSSAGRWGCRPRCSAARTAACPCRP